MTAASKPLTTLGTLGKFASGAGLGLSGIVIGYDFYRWRTKEISGLELSYKGLGFISVVGAGFMSSNPYGLAVGLGFNAGDKAYETAVQVKGEFGSQVSQFYNTLISSWLSRKIIV